MATRAFDILAVTSALVAAVWIVAALSSGAILPAIWSAGATTFFAAATSQARLSPGEGSFPFQLACGGAIVVLMFAIFLGFIWPSLHAVIALACAVPLLVASVGVVRPGALLRRRSVAAVPLAAAVLAMVGAALLGLWQLYW